MSDTPLQDALDRIPKNELTFTGEASKTPGTKVEAEIALTLERERALANGTSAVGVTAGVSTDKGGYVAGFWRRIWK